MGTEGNARSLDQRAEDGCGGSAEDAFHLIPLSSWLGNIAIPHDGQLHVAKSWTVPQCGLTME